MVLEERIFKVFISNIYFKPLRPRNAKDITALTILVEGQLMIICVKLFQNWTRGLGGVSTFKSIVNGRTDEDRSQKLTSSLRDR